MNLLKNINLTILDLHKSILCNFLLGKLKLLSKYLLIKFFPHMGHITIGFWTNRAWVPAKSLYVLRVKEWTKKFIQVININQQLPLKAYWKWCSISFTHSKCIVCPHRKTVMSFVVSNRNCAIRGHINSFWNRAFPLSN